MIHCGLEESHKGMKIVWVERKSKTELSLGLEGKYAVDNRTRLSLSTTNLINLQNQQQSEADSPSMLLRAVEGQRA